MTSGNPILDKNLESIEKYNPKLKEKLLNLPYLTNHFDLVETELKESNLTYNGFPLHSQQGAELEAKKIFDGIHNSFSVRHVVFGIGLGYLFKECCEKSKGVVLLYEPNLEILRVTLEMVDFSKELSQNNVFVTSDIEKFKEFYTDNYVYKANPSVLILDSYKNYLYASELQNILAQLNIIFCSNKVLMDTIIKCDLAPVEELFKNIPYMLKAAPLYEFKDIYKGKTALIVSAGPTLDSNIEIIKNNRDKFIIFCTGTAFKALANNGITPDFVNIVENLDCSGQLLGFDLSEINLITEPYTNNAVYLLKVKQNLLFPSDRCSVNNYWANLAEVDISHYMVKGTVSYAALASAKMMGFSKLILVGQDLAYLNNQCYCSNGTYSELRFEFNPQTKQQSFILKDKQKYLESFASANKDKTQKEIEEYADSILKETVEFSTFVKGINGDVLPTNAGYATFVEFFSEFAYLNPNLDLINTSMIGAQINGFKNIPLEEALKDVQPVLKIELDKSFKYNDEKILMKLENDFENLTRALKDFINARGYIFQYEIEMENQPILTKAGADCVKELLSIYNKIVQENNNCLYSAISIVDNLELVHKLNESENMGVADIVELFVLLKNYYCKVEKKLINITNKISEAKESIRESINSKSQESIGVN